MADTEEVEHLRRRARRRLVGAAAVVLFLVIVPPMLMDLEPKPVTSNLSVEIPPPAPLQSDSRTSVAAKDAAMPGREASNDAPLAGGDSGKDASAPGKDRGRDLPITPSTIGQTGKQSQPPGTQAPAPAVESQPSAAQGQSPGTASQPPAASGRAASPQGEAVTATAAAGVSYFVPLGTFAAREHAQQVVRKAGQLGVKVYAEAYSTPKGERTRVRAGPYHSKEEAERARTALREAGIDAAGVAAVRHGEKRG